MAEVGERDSAALDVLDALTEAVGGDDSWWRW